MLNQHQIPNGLLARMTAPDFDRLMVRASIVDLIKGNDLLFPGQPIDHCWFPLSGMISAVAVDADDNGAEVGMIGRDGMSDVGAILGDTIAATRSLVQLAGQAVRVPAAELSDLLATSPTALQLLLVYSRAFSIQIAGSALAYARYTIPRRLARWLLMCADRVDGSDISLTHEALSLMLGVRRAGITVALGELEAAGMVRLHRSGLNVLNRAGLVLLAGAGYGEAEANYGEIDGPVVDTARIGATRSVADSADRRLRAASGRLKVERKGRRTAQSGIATRG